MAVIQKAVILKNYETDFSLKIIIRQPILLPCDSSKCTGGLDGQTQYNKER